VTARAPVRSIVPTALLLVGLACQVTTADGPRSVPTEADGVIATEIERRFTRDPDVNASAIRIEVRDGNVTLYGRVADTDAQERAKKVAAAVDGVADVQNRLSVGSGAGLGQRGGPGPIPEQMPGAD
jgi:hypothetical protein